MNKPKLIDTHTHVNFNAFKDDSKDVIARALGDGIWMINVGSQASTSERALRMAKEYKSGVYAAVGLHPSHLCETEVDYREEGEKINYISKKEDFDEEFYLKLAEDEKVVAIGECGLDYTEVDIFKEKQKEVFLKHINLAHKIKKPIIIHCRDAHEEMINLLSSNKEFLMPDAGVAHFFTGTLEQAEMYVKLGFYISFSGVITLTDDYNDVVRSVPLDKILVETDAPYVSPKPCRGKRNEPSYIKYTAQKIADLRAVSFDEIAMITTENARRLFGLFGK